MFRPDGTRMPINSLVQGGGTDLRLLHLAEDHRVLARELLDVVLRELLGRRADVGRAALLRLQVDLLRGLDLLGETARVGPGSLEPRYY